MTSTPPSSVSTPLSATLDANIGKALRQQRQQALQQAQALHEAKQGGLMVVQALSDLIDKVVLEAWQAAWNHCRQAFPQALKTQSIRLALVALGGYGRRQLHPFSDIDLLFLHAGRLSPLEEQLVKATLHALWDANFEVGHCTRTVTECIRIAQQDVASKTSMFESRLLAGDHRLYEKFRRRYYRFAQRMGIQSFVWVKENERQQRYDKFGDEPGLQEPNIKECAGGLRDFQHTIWLAMVCWEANTLEELEAKNIISHELFLQVRSAIDFLLQVRNDLHFHLKRRSNVLGFDVQETAAKNLGYEDTADGLAEEYFMRDLHRSLWRLQRAADVVSAKALQLPWWKRLLRFRRGRYLDHQVYDRSGLLYCEDAEGYFRDNPEHLVKLFGHLQETMGGVSPALSSQVVASLEMIDQTVRRQRSVAEAFLKLLNRPGRVAQALRALHHHGVLARYLPEFGEVVHLVRRDFYHRYTVDEHSLLTVEAIDALFERASRPKLDFTYEELAHLDPRAGRRFRRWAEIHAPECLPPDLRRPQRFVTPPDEGSAPLASSELGAHWRLIIETAAKIERIDMLYLAAFLHDLGKGSGQDHSARGAQIAAEVCRRLGLDAGTTDLVCWLVGEHLAMSKVAFTRDTEDWGTLESFADLCGTPQRLALLFVQTFADLAAVNVDMLNEWKFTLLARLYRRVLPILEDRAEAERKRQLEIRVAAARILETMPRDIEIPEAERHLNLCGPRYITRCPPELIHQHLRLLRHWDLHTPIVQAGRGAGAGIIQLTTIHRSQIGNFASVTRATASLKINIHEAQLYWRQDGIALVSLTLDSEQRPERQTQEFFDKLAARVYAALNNQWKAEWDPQLRSTPGRGRSRIEPHVEIYNRASREFTVVEVRCLDFLGVLARMAAAFAQARVDIRFARIHTQGEQVIDTFYVLSELGAKLIDTAQVQELRSALLAAVAPPGEGAKGTVHLRQE